MSLVKLTNNRKIDIWVNTDQIAMVFQEPGVVPAQSIMMLANGAVEKFDMSGDVLARHLGYKEVWTS